MKLRTSFSKLTSFKKDILRFAPIWALYLIGMMLVLPETASYADYDRFANSYMAGYVKSFAVVNIIYAAVCAVMLFGDLYNTRMCYSLHAMPQRRESWLLSHLGAGLLFSLVPNFLAALFLMVRLESMWYLALYWLLAVTLQFIFFFGLATVSALLTGNRFAMLAVYAGFNFVAMLIYAVLALIYTPMLYGVVTNYADFTPFSPVVHLFQFDYFEFEKYQVLSEKFPGEWENHYRYLGLSTGWGYTAILGGLGVAMMALSVLLYRLRHLESAGDFVAFRKLNVPACLIITLCVALCVALLGEAFGSMVIWLAVGVVVGYFGSLMLLERRIKVFRKKTFLGFGALVLALIISFVAVQFDWFGIVRWTPDADRVQSVTIANYRSNNYFYNGDYYYTNRIAVTLTEKDEISDIIEAHEDIIDRMDETPDQAHYVVISYTMNSGRTVTRAYSAPANGKNYEIFTGYFYTPQQILGYQDWASFVSGIEYMNCDFGQIPEEMYAKVMDALRVDCEMGQISLNYQKDNAFYLEYWGTEQNTTVTRTLYIPSSAGNTVTLLKSPEIAMGFTDWETYLPNVLEVWIDSYPVDREDYESLLKAVWEDCQDGLVSRGGSDSGVLIDIKQNDAQLGTFHRTLFIDADAPNTNSWLQENDWLDEEGLIAGK